jgi:pyridoxal phosphate enzyme (YggS family)
LFPSDRSAIEIEAKRYCEKVTNSGLRDRLAVVYERIHAAAARAHRPSDSVRLVAVTKVFPATAICDAYELGVRDFGENYVQEFEGKTSQVSGLTEARVHLIGHLQSNKARRAAELFQVIQTVDSPKLARRLNDAGSTLDVMIEVKLSDEGSKSGADPADVPAIVEACRACPNLKLLGLMTVPPWSENAEESRPYFARLREIAGAHDLQELSMGMSNDLEVAIEEGATCVRVGTALFGKRKKPA